MSEYLYTVADRISQLKSLASALAELVPVAESIPAAVYAEDYRLALAQIDEFQHKGFTQEQLSTLARAIPDVVDRRKDWMPPMRRTDAGEWVEEEWWEPFDQKLQPVLSLARALKTLGYY